MREAGSMRSYFRSYYIAVLALTILFACRLSAHAQIEGAGTALTGPHRPLIDPNAAQKPLYLLQPGDTINVSFRYTPELNDEVVIGPDGRTSLKAAGELSAAGHTVAELQQAIIRASAIKLMNPEVAVTLRDYDRPHVFVAGEVNTPGKLELRRPTTALQAILASGGPKDDAALSRVLLFRHIDADTAEVHVLQLGSYGARSRGKNDMVLQPDDVILVRHDIPSRIERYMKILNLGFYLNPLQNVGAF
ncbi:MAG: polysaccharide biosynthesis/export family protein [Janthinobacterium lividum]